MRRYSALAVFLFIAGFLSNSILASDDHKESSTDFESVCRRSAEADDVTSEAWPEAFAQDYLTQYFAPNLELDASLSLPSNLDCHRLCNRVFVRCQHGQNTFSVPMIVFACYHDSIDFIRWASTMSVLSFYWRDQYGRNLFHYAAAGVR